MDKYQENKFECEIDALINNYYGLKDEERDTIISFLTAWNESILWNRLNKMSKIKYSKNGYQWGIKK